MDMKPTFKVRAPFYERGFQHFTCRKEVILLPFDVTELTSRIVANGAFGVWQYDAGLLVIGDADQKIEIEETKLDSLIAVLEATQQELRTAVHQP